jgi:glutathione synthase/RimK-type ligase-like ATP-grasp enzyme
LSAHQTPPSRIAFATSADWRALWKDDIPAVDELARRGHIVDAVVWDDPAIDWTVYDVVILRSTWDYYLKPDAFARWIDDLDARAVAMWNPAATLRWNLDKIYLQELAAAGVPITPTVFPPPGTRLADVARERGWVDLVLKPRVSAAGHRTVRLDAADSDMHQAELDDLIAHGGALVQQYLPVIETDGEWSFIFIDGAYSHAARKRAAAGEFRVQFQYGGTTETGAPSEELVAQARRVVDSVTHPWLYARVDGCVVDGQLLLMELEMLEPSLFLLQDPGSSGRLADGIEARLKERLAGNRAV